MNDQINVLPTIEFSFAENDPAIFARITEWQINPLPDAQPRLVIPGRRMAAN